MLKNDVSVPIFEGGGGGVGNGWTENIIFPPHGRGALIGYYEFDRKTAKEDINKQYHVINALCIYNHLLKPNRPTTG